MRRVDQLFRGVLPTVFVCLFVCLFVCNLESSRVRRSKPDSSVATQRSCPMIAVLRPKHVALM